MIRAGSATPNSDRQTHSEVRLLKRRLRNSVANSVTNLIASRGSGLHTRPTPTSATPGNKPANTEITHENFSKE